MRIDLIDSRIAELYEDFQGFPVHKSIVRSGIRDDAFVLLVFEILFQNYHNVKKFVRSEINHMELLIKSVVPPPDDSVDIFFEEKDVDECKYHIVQVKNKVLTPAEIESCFVLMDNSINLYIKRPKDTRKNLKELILETDFSSQYKGSCTYYVVHRGQTNYIRNQPSNYKIITIEELAVLEDGTRQMSVPKEAFEIDTANNFIVNNYVDGQANQVVNNNLPKSLLCNFSGYDLAKLNNKYSNTLLGRNILYGHNLRESLNRNSKTFDKMFDTIDKEPDLFLFYNNGITIISSCFNAYKKEGKENIVIEDFSIINGAQTTSTLGAYLREAEMNNENEKIENLKKVFVLTKIYQINNQLVNHDNITEKIKIYNNTQTPLSSRDMVSFRKEQIALQERLYNNPSPNVFIYIKKGECIPNHIRTYPHQRITNETLAQLALCGFCSEPFTAKDKKATIFDNEGNENFILNQVYHKLFNPDTGILFESSKKDIDELLFIYKLHEDTKNHQKAFYKEQLINLNQTQPKNDIDKKSREDQKDRIKRNIEISNVCLFFNITCYYEIRKSFDFLISNIDSLSFLSKKYYDKSEDYKEKIIKQFSKFAYSRTVDIIRRNSGVENVNNWIRSEKNQQVFLNDLRNYLTTEGHTISDDYVSFVNEFKIASA